MELRPPAVPGQVDRARVVRAACARQARVLRVAAVVPQAPVALVDQAVPAGPVADLVAVAVWAADQTYSK